MATRIKPTKAGALLVSTAALITTLASCGSHKSAQPPPPTAPPTTTVNEVVIKDYRAFWDMYLAVTNPMNPGDPRLAQHSTGNELDMLNAALLAGKAQGEVHRGTLDLAPHVENVSGNVAVVDDCYFDHTGIYVVSTGERKDKEDTDRRNAEVTLKLDGGIWKVSDINQRTASCVPS